MDRSRFTSLALDRDTHRKLKELAGERTIASFLREVVIQGEMQGQLQVMRSSVDIQEGHVAQVNSRLEQAIAMVKALMSKCEEDYREHVTRAIGIDNAVKGQQKNIVQLTATTGLMLDYLDGKFPGIKSAVIAQGKDWTEKMLHAQRQGGGADEKHA